MRSLFLKVFLWFWLAMILVVGALAATDYVARTVRGPRPPQFINGILWAYSRNAVASFERDGAAGLNTFLDHVERDAGIRAHLFDARATELAGREATPDEKAVAREAVRAGSLVTRQVGSLIYEATPMHAGDGSRYAFVAAFPFGHTGLVQSSGSNAPKPPGRTNVFFSDTPTALVLRGLAVVLIVGLLCYLLARYIVAPVVKLRAVTRQVAGGDLSARVGPLLGNRHDELADLGHDFDIMASKIEALMSAQQRLLRDISHELRSPLARLGVALDLLRKRTAPEATSYLARIEREAGRLNEMIGQLLSLSRWETGVDGTRRMPVDLAALVRDVVEDADFEARGHDRAVELIACEGCETNGTPLLLRSAIENVVRNAVRHTPEGTAVKVSLGCQRVGEGGQAVISVEDAGAGVPEAMLADIFRPFYRVDDARDRGRGGTGLGLAITERAVQQHGGTVAATNVAGGGFRVEMRLPLLQPDAVSDTPARRNNPSIN